MGNVFTSPSYCLDLWIVELCGQFLMDIDGVVVGDLDMELTPHNPTGGFPNGYLTFDMDLMGIEITLVPIGVFSACVDFIGCASETVDFDAVVGADEINLEVDVGLYVDSSNEIQVSLANMDVGIDNLYLDLSDLGIVGDILGSVTTWILGVFEPVFEALLPPIMEAALPGVLEDAFADLEIAQEIDLMGATLEIAAVPQAIDIDPDTGLVTGQFDDAGVGEHVLQIEARDDHGAARVLEVAVTVTNVAPVFDAPPAALQVDEDTAL